MNLHPFAIRNHTEITTWRKHFHQNPETAYEEVQTAQKIKDLLHQWGIPFKDQMGKTGIVATIDGKIKSDQCIGLRADMDALPMQELNDFSHKSQSKGKMHACGHDGHTAMLLGATKYLQESKNFAGKVHLIFQPAEEGQAGAKAMMDDGLFKDFPMQEVYAVHNWPGYPKGKMATQEGGMMAANDRFEILVKGKGCHAAMPETGNDSIIAATNIINNLQTIVSRKISPLEAAVISVTKIHGGSAFNIIPEEVAIGGCIRTLNEQTRQKVRKMTEEVAKNTCQTFQASCEFKIKSGYPVTFNHKEQTMKAISAAKKTVGADNVITQFNPTMGSEDFSFMLQEIPGNYLFIGNDQAGAGSPCMLHNPYYDFNDEIIPIGVTYFINLVENTD